MTKQVYIDISENFNNSFYSVLHWLSPPTLYLSPLPYVQGLCRLKYCSQRIGSLWVRRLCHLWKVYICCITLCSSSVKLVQNLFHFIKLWPSCQHMLHHSVSVWLRRLCLNEKVFNAYFFSSIEVSSSRHKRRPHIT